MLISQCNRNNKHVWIHQLVICSTFELRVHGFSFPRVGGLLQDEKNNGLISGEFYQWYRVNVLYFLYLLEWLTRLPIDHSTKTKLLHRNLGLYRIYVHMRFVLSSCYFLGFPLTNRLPIEVPSNCWLKHTTFIWKENNKQHLGLSLQKHSKTIKYDTLYPAQTQCNCESWKFEKQVALKNDDDIFNSHSCSPHFWAAPQLVVHPF